MYIQEISIDMRSEIDIGEVTEEFELLLWFYRAGGQIQGKIQSEYLSGNTLRSLPYTLEKNSLDKKFNNLYIKNQTKKLEKLCDSKLHFTTVGTSRPQSSGVCKCIQSEFYILFTEYVSISSPIVCGTCDKLKPLYRLPIFEDHGYAPILSWESNYQSCDTLQMNCEVGEEWAAYQMQEVTSELSKQGRDICSKIEHLALIPTYYYLYNYQPITEHNDKLRPCPGCGNKWLSNSPICQVNSLAIFFKCDTCRLVSNVTMNSDLK